MAVEGIEIAAEKPQDPYHPAVKTSDVVITMGCGDACPYYPGKRYEDWTLDDPADQDRGGNTQLKAAAWPSSRGYDRSRL
jgi:protein-tyrosine-phosphatase